MDRGFQNEHVFVTDGERDSEVCASQCQHRERCVEALGVLAGNCGGLREEHTNGNEGPSSYPESGPAVNCMLS